MEILTNVLQIELSVNSGTGDECGDYIGGVCLTAGMSSTNFSCKLGFTKLDYMGFLKNCYLYSYLYQNLDDFH